ncbi:hypothetical protein Bca4012_001337 [Brassica carinata]
MATCTMTEYFCPPKKRRLDIASGESKSYATRPNLRSFNPDDDECIRQYILYYYQFQRSEELGLYSSITFRQVTGAVLVVFTILHSRLWIWLHPGPSQSFIKQNVASVDPRFARFISLGLNQRMKIAAVQVDPPPPLNDNDPEVPTVSFTVTGPGSGFIPNVVFTRTPAQVSVSSPESSSPTRESQNAQLFIAPTLLAT